MLSYYIMRYPHLIHFIATFFHNGRHKDISSGSICSSSINLLALFQNILNTFDNNFTLLGRHSTQCERSKNGGRHN